MASHVRNISEMAGVSPVGAPSSRNDDRAGGWQWLSLARAQLELNRHAQAADSLRRADAASECTDPARNELWRGVAEAAMHANDLALAADAYQAILDVDAGNASAWRSLAQCRISQDDPLMGEYCLLRALELRPDFHVAMCDFLMLMIRQGRIRESRTWADRILEMAPGDAQGQLFHAATLELEWKLQEALDVLDRIESSDSNVQAIVLKLKGTIFIKLGRNEESLECMERSIALSAQPTEARINAAAALMNLHRLDEALARLDAILETHPTHALAMRGKTQVLVQMGRLEECAALEQRCLSLSQQLSDDAAFLFDCGLSSLLAGDFRRGWDLYEHRWRMSTRGVERHRPQGVHAEWDGEPLADRTILLYTEQGLGDMIQVLRYVPQVCAAARKVYLTLSGALHPLLGLMPANCELVHEGDFSPQVDFACAFMSLPRVLGTTLENIPRSVPYLDVPADTFSHWRARLGAAHSLRVGLAWSGNPDHANDRNRSIPLAQVLAHAPGDVEFISLQKEVRPRDLETLRGCKNMRHFGDELKSFADTAALASLVNVVLSVDTSIAHLAGALGRPLSLLIPFAPDWRWLLGRNDSPWYPSATLYRQPVPGQWAPAIAMAMQDLHRHRQTGAR